MKKSIEKRLEESATRFEENMKPRAGWHKSFTMKIGFRAGYRAGYRAALRTAKKGKK